MNCGIDNWEWARINLGSLTDRKSRPVDKVVSVNSHAGFLTETMTTVLLCSCLIVNMILTFKITTNNFYNFK